MVRELTPALGMFVLRVYEVFDEVLRLPINDEWRRGRLFMISKGVRVFGFKLGDMEHGVHSDRAREVKSEGHGGGLRDDREGADLSFS